MATNAIEFTGDMKIPKTPNRDKSVVSKRNTRGLIQFKMIAPRKREIVSPAKTILIPRNSCIKRYSILGNQYIGNICVDGNFCSYNQKN